MASNVAIEPFFLFANFGKKSLKYALDILLFLAPVAAYSWPRPRRRVQRRLDTGQGRSAKWQCLAGNPNAGTGPGRRRFQVGFRQADRPRGP